MNLSKNEQLPLTIRLYRATGRLRRRIDHHLTSVTDEHIKREMEIQNQKFKKLALSSTKKFRMFYRKYLMNYESEIFHLTGKSKLSGNPFVVLYVGDRVSMKYLIQSFFQNNDVQKVSMGRVLTSKMKQIIDPEKQEVDLIVFERIINDKWTPPYGEWIRSPRWIRMVYRISENDDIDSFMRKLKKKNWTNLTKIRKVGFFPLQSQRKEDIEFFYHRMYKPLIEKRYPDYGDILSLEFFQGLMSSGFLLFSCLPDGQKVAGEIFITCGKTLYGVVNGLIDGDDNLYEMGALSSLYVFAFEYAYSNQYYCVDQAEARPIKSDGVYLHKKNWGFITEISPWLITDWLFWIPNKSLEAYDWAKANKFLPQFSKIHGEQIGLIYSEK